MAERRYQSKLPTQISNTLSIPHNLSQKLTPISLQVQDVTTEVVDIEVAIKGDMVEAQHVLLEERIQESFNMGERV